MTLCPFSAASVFNISFNSAGEQDSSYLLHGAPESSRLTLSEVNFPSPSATCSITGWDSENLPPVTTVSFSPTQKVPSLSCPATGDTCPERTVIEIELDDPVRWIWMCQAGDSLTVKEEFNCRPEVQYSQSQLDLIDQLAAVTTPPVHSAANAGATLLVNDMGPSLDLSIGHCFVASSHTGPHSSNTVESLLIADVDVIETI